MNIQRIFQDNLILRQCTCFIRAKDINRSQILNGIEFLDDNFFFAIRIEPLAKLAVMTIGSISGVKPTPTLSANTPASTNLRLSDH